MGTESLSVSNRMLDSVSIPRVNLFPEWSPLIECWSKHSKSFNCSKLISGSHPLIPSSSSVNSLTEIYLKYTMASSNHPAWAGFVTYCVPPHGFPGVHPQVPSTVSSRDLWMLLLKHSNHYFQNIKWKLGLSCSLILWPHLILHVSHSL